jgi:hypothetical protein
VTSSPSWERENERTCPCSLIALVSMPKRIFSFRDY